MVSKEILKKYCKQKYGDEIVIKTYDIQEIKQIINFTKQLLIPLVGNCKTKPKLNRLENELGKLQKVHGEIIRHFKVHNGCDSFKFKDGAVYRVKLERNQTKVTFD